MTRLALSLLLASCLTYAVKGCELQALVNSALECSQSGQVVNITKYGDYFTKLVADGTPPPGSYTPVDAEEFLRNHTFSEMAQMFGELEPTAVWMLNSFYQEHLASLTQENFLRPLFGDMSMMGQLLNNSLASHCRMLNGMGACMNQKMLQKCTKQSDATIMKTQIIDPLLNRFCSGFAVKAQTYEWLSSHSTGMTSAFSCFVNRSNLPTRLDFRDFEHDPLLITTNFERMLVKCNAVGVGSPINRWYEENLADLFQQDFDWMKFNVVELLKRNISQQFLRLIEPLGRCMVYEFKPFVENLCPNVNIDGEISKLKEILAYVLPFFVPDQQKAFQIVESHQPPPDLGAKARSTVALVGSSHIYNVEQQEWVASCPPSAKDGFLVLSVGDFSVTRMADGSIRTNQLLFNSTGIYLLFPWSQPSEVPLTSELHSALYYLIFGFNVVTDTIDTDYVTYFTLKYSKYGAFISIHNPTGENWVVFMRSAVGLHQLGYGALSKDCRGNGGFKSNVNEVAAAASEMCKSKCTQAGALVDACAYDCSTYNMERLPEELVALHVFSKKIARSDRVARNMAVNQHGETYAPCSSIGFVSNAGATCAYRTMLSGLMPTFNYSMDTGFTSIIRDIGVIEPYVLYAVTALFKEFVVGPPAKSFLGGPSMDYTPFVSDSLLLSTMEKHCRLMGPFTKCLFQAIPDYCRPSGGDFVKKYLRHLPGRYCTDMDTDTPRVDQQVFSDMMSVRDGLLDEMSCVVSSVNENDFSFNMERLTRMYELLDERCNFGTLVSYVTDMVTSLHGNILEDVIGLVRIARNPVRCALKVIPIVCPSMNAGTLVEKLVPHLNRLTSGTFNFTKEWFINVKDIDYGSRQRVSMLAVGDPHIRHLDAERFSMCNSPGLQTYFSSDEQLRVELKGHNDPATSNTNATVIRSVSLHVWTANASFEDAPVLKYEANNGDLPTTFSNNMADVTVGAFPISIQSVNMSRVLIRNRKAGLTIAIVKFKEFYNLVVRMARDYAERGTGLLITGCNLQAQNVTEINEETAEDAKRRKRTLTVEECRAVCANVSAVLGEECLFDCIVTEDTSIADAHVAAIEAEQEVVEEDEKIFEVLTTTPAVGQQSSTKPTTKRKTEVSSSCLSFVSSFLLTLSVLCHLG